MEFFGYSDSDKASDPHTRKSAGADLFLAASGPILRACKKHLSICLSITEVEYNLLTALLRKLCRIDNACLTWDKNRQNLLKFYATI